MMLRPLYAHLRPEDVMAVRKKAERQIWALTVLAGNAPKPFKAGGRPPLPLLRLAAAHREENWPAFPSRIDCTPFTLDRETGPPELADRR